MYDSTYNLHKNDTKNYRKHMKMQTRALKGKLNPNCKWAKKHGSYYTQKRIV